MSDSLAQKVAEFQRQRILNRPGMSDVLVVLFESDNQVGQDRIVIDAERKEESPEGSGIFRVAVSCTVRVKVDAASVVDQWLAEIDATQTEWTPDAPSADYAAALDVLFDLFIVNETDGDRETTGERRQFTREFDVMAR